ncbi:39S ribosomal protein L22, mitochondrial [Coemansia sp. Benny D115]|nr:39S ribosomal protein L22, mitochondrial [Coemansia sp. Benny D115]
MFGLVRSLNRLGLGSSVSGRLLHSTAKVTKKGDDAPANSRVADQSASSVFSINESKENTGLRTVSAGKGEGLVSIREHAYSTVNFHVSPRKLRLIGNQISGLPVSEAIRQMEFSAKKASNKILHSLVWARKNAIYQKSMNPDNMFIKLARVGKGKYRKRLDPKARGRFGVIRVPSAHMKYVLWEKQPENQPVPRNVVEKALLAGKQGKRDVKGFTLTKKVWMPLNESKPVINPKPYYNW